MVPAHKGAEGQGAQLSNAQRVVAGCISGGASQLAVYPLEVLRTHVTMGNHATRPGSSYYSVARDIVKAQVRPKAGMCSPRTWVAPYHT